MKTTHTPGPWTAQFGNGLLSVSVQSSDSHICAVSKLPMVRSLETEANARLIAAAPDLLAAACIGLSWMQAHERFNAVPKGGPLSLDIERVRAAIEGAAP
jgi:hypothetical protein